MDKFCYIKMLNLYSFTYSFSKYCCDSPPYILYHLENNQLPDISYSIKD